MFNSRVLKRWMSLIQLVLCVTGLKRWMSLIQLVLCVNGLKHTLVKTNSFTLMVVAAPSSETRERTRGTTVV